jgi:hypothetical protein
LLEFSNNITNIIFKHGITEGYRESFDENETFEFIQHHLAGRWQHPLGEVVTKLLRFNKAGKGEDLIKAAGWLALIYSALPDRAGGEADPERLECEYGRSELPRDAGEGSSFLPRTLHQSGAELGDVPGGLLFDDLAAIAQYMESLPSPLITSQIGRLFGLFTRIRKSIGTLEARAPGELDESKPAPPRAVHPSGTYKPL